MRHLAIAIALLCAFDASAEQLTPDERATLRNACGADIREHCAGILPGGGRLARCIRETSVRFSPDCKTTMSTIAASRPQQQQ
ncbi:hypothetical protein [Rhizobium sp. BK251]|uniref:hypothetical protein n=1 Tax=Rhizobium sp. BK251 TaxID=2512125 RepID=UPI00104F2C5F|nr:hypothetical protein [Rhizobium sp. BK251]TCL69874.1 hypothetical protein EV286_108452 [Rhizobium sp. BK251]